MKKKDKWNVCTREFQFIDLFYTQKIKYPNVGSKHNIKTTSTKEWINGIMHVHVLQVLHIFYDNNRSNM